MGRAEEAGRARKGRGSVAGGERGTGGRGKDSKAIASRHGRLHQSCIGLAGLREERSSQPGGQGGRREQREQAGGAAR